MNSNKRTKNIKVNKAIDNIGDSTSIEASKGRNNNKNSTSNPNK